MTASPSDLAPPPPPGPDPQDVRTDREPGAPDIVPAQAIDLYRRMVLARRFNDRATLLSRQGRLAVYPSSTGQEACQVGAVAALSSRDWLFPTYRDTAAVVSRGVDPVEALDLFRGARHHGFDSRAHRVAPLCTPLATHCPHAVGLAHAAALAGDDVVALALLGDGATSEGDFHEALNFAAVVRAPVVFLVQNNGYAISVPLRKQSAAFSLASKANGYGMPGVQVDGNDVLAVHRAVGEALRHARRGEGPTLIEALTYRLEPHTNADDDRRYRSVEEVEAWRDRDPLPLMERYLVRHGLFGDAEREALRSAADEQDHLLRRAFESPPDPDPLDLFAHVYSRATPQLAEQRELLVREIAQTGGTTGGAR